MKKDIKRIKITSDIHTPEKVPYFMWDYFLTNKQIKEILNSDDEERKIWLTAKIMRDAKFEDIRQLVDLDFVFKNKEKFKYRLGRMKPVWDFLFDRLENYGFAKK